MLNLRLVVPLLPMLALLTRESRCADCNDNSIPDDRDITGGASLDCNRNGMPDECDLRPSRFGFVNWGTIEFKFPSDPGPLELADLDGDAHLDAIMAHPGTQEQPGSSLSVFRGRGDGTFEDPGVLAVDPGPIVVRAADLDGDGNTDLITSNKYASTLSFLFNRGGGNFDAVRSLESGFGSPYWVVIRDLDGDGDVDLAVPVTPDQRVFVYLNQGNTTFGSPRGLSGVGLIDAGDLDGDGDVDLAVQYQQYLAVVRNRGGAMFTQPIGVAPSSGLGSILARDLDGDGALDLVAAAADVTVVLNQGNSKFSDPFLFRGRGSLIAEDFDGDLDLDLLVPVDRATGSPALLLNEGSGSFPEKVVLPAWIGTAWRASGDVNGDGRSDLVFADVEGIFTAWGNGDGTFAAARDFVSPHYAQTILSEDFNGDGRADLAAGRFQWVSVLLNDGSGQLPRTDDYRMDNRFLTAGDFNGDAHLDLAMISGWQPAVSVLRNDQRGGFGSSIVSAVVGGEPLFTLPAADFDHDGDLDLATRQGLAGGVGGAVLVLLNDGQAAFVEGVPLTVDPDAFRVSAGDVDGDGNPDLVLPSPQSNSVTIYLNQKDGTFAESAKLPVGRDPQESVVIADLDGNGEMDLAVPFRGTSNPAGGYVGSGTSVLLNQGGKQFAAAEDYLTGSIPDGVIAVDLDGDDHLDLVAACIYDVNLSFLLNHGDGTFFRDRPMAFGWKWSPVSTAAPDLDGDGLRELVVAIDYDDRLFVLRNTTLPPASKDLNRNRVPDECDRAGFHRGDADGSGELDLTDAIFLLDHLFNAGRIPACREAADTDNDAAIDLTDPIYLLNYLFLSGNPPAPPGAPPAPCGTDPDSPGSPGDLGCDSYGRC